MNSMLHTRLTNQCRTPFHDDVIRWKHFPRYWPFVRGIHRSPVNSLHKGQWRWALMFSLICIWINAWVNNREAGDLRRYRAHYDVIVMCNTIYLGRLSEVGAWINSPTTSPTPSPPQPQPQYRIYASGNWASTDSGNSLSSVRRQAITWTNADILSIWPSGTNIQWNFNQNTFFSLLREC